MSDEPTDGADGTYEVGYGKPPTHSRFKPGQSGNPKGKRKGAKSFSVLARAALNEKVTVRTAKGPKRMTKLEALLQTTMNNALKGEAKAGDRVFRVARDLGLADELAAVGNGPSTEQLRDDDQAILARFRASLRQAPSDDGDA